MSEAWRGGSTREWRRLRALILELNRQTNGGHCRAGVLRVCKRVASVAHHTLGRNVTGDDPRFIVAICAPCNIHIGDPQTHPKKCAQCVNVDFGPHYESPKPLSVTKW